MPGGRPTSYTLEIAKEICDTIASTGTGLKSLCKKHSHWPHPDTIYLWIKTHKEFSDFYARAKKAQVTALVEDILEISDDSSQDTYEDENGNVRFNSEFAARSRLRVDTRKWIAAKLVPRLYGDNALARELSDEIEEFRKKLGMQPKRNLDHGSVDSEDSQENTEE